MEEISEQLSVEFDTLTQHKCNSDKELPVYMHYTLRYPITT